MRLIARERSSGGGISPCWRPAGIDDEHSTHYLAAPRGGMVLIIDDWELFDYVDDFLVSHDMTYDRYSEGEVGGRPAFTMHFGLDVSEGKLFTLLNEIPRSEIERIWLLNNS